MHCICNDAIHTDMHTYTRKWYVIYDGRRSEEAVNQAKLKSAHSTVCVHVIKWVMKYSLYQCAHKATFALCVSACLYLYVHSKKFRSNAETYDHVQRDPTQKSSDTDAIEWSCILKRQEITKKKFNKFIIRRGENVHILTREQFLHLVFSVYSSFTGWISMDVGCAVRGFLHSTFDRSGFSQNECNQSLNCYANTVSLVNISLEADSSYRVTFKISSIKHPKNPVESIQFVEYLKHSNKLNYSKCCEKEIHSH